MVPLLILYCYKIQLYCCHFQQRCTYHNGSTDSSVLYIQVISSTDVNKQNLNTTALNAQPTCISRYHRFINKIDTAAVMAEDWWGISGFKRRGQFSNALRIFNFPDKYFNCSLIPCMLHVSPTLYKLRSVHYEFQPPPTLTSQATFRVV